MRNAKSVGILSFVLLISVVNVTTLVCLIRKMSFKKLRTVTSYSNRNAFCRLPDQYFEGTSSIMPPFHEVSS
ncbi:hypothetical protein V1521DRAFT_427097 [Lipomyces starkeyi]